MIVINALLIFGLFLVQCGLLSDAAGTDTSRFPFLRRRTSSMVKRVDPPADGIIRDQHEKVQEVAPVPKTISFGLRQRTDSVEKPPSSNFGNMFSNFYFGIKAAIESIDDLELEFRMNEEKVKADEECRRIMAASNKSRTSIVEKIISSFKKPTIDDEDGSDICSESSGDIAKNQSYSECSCSDQESEQDIVKDDNTFVFQSNSASFDDDDSQNETVDLELNCKSLDDSQIVSKDLEMIPLDQIERPELGVLSDSDAESWELVERYVNTSFQVLVRKPLVDQLLDQSGQKKSIVDFLGQVFLKLAKRILFNPPQAKLKKAIYVDDFVTDFTDAKEFDGMDEEKHVVLDGETAQRILFFNDLHCGTHDWSIVLPLETDYQDALYTIDTLHQKDSTQIDVDLVRLPPRYLNFYAERFGRDPLDTDKEELVEKIKQILAFCIAFESKETVGDLESITTPKNQRISYSQGFDQVAAYFAINFDLDCAGPLAHRFFQLYLAELINIDGSQSLTVYREIDAKAIKIVRKYLRSQVEEVTLDFEIIFELLQFYPFSDVSASIMYFTSATTWTDLDRLVQFLLLKVPQYQASKSISLLAAANMLYCFLTLEELLNKELGSQEWAQLKANIGAKSGKERHGILDELALKFMGEFFLAFSSKIVHSGEEFDEFIKVAESLVPYLHQF